MVDLPSIESLRRSSKDKLTTIETLAELEAFQLEWLGRKGTLTTYLKTVGQLPIDQKRTIGKEANELRDSLAIAIGQKMEVLKRKELARKLESDALDISLPGIRHPIGHQHPLSQVMDELVSIFNRLGFTCADGPELESEFYNFEALNVPDNHPARDMQDTFYLALDRHQLSLPIMESSAAKKDPVLLRTHTSPVQVHVMETHTPPIAVVVPGRVYRHEALDATHSHIFHQLEGLFVDEGLSFVDLKGCLSQFAQQFFGPSVKSRFRPSFFPFTEPSAEMDISCLACSGSGCRICKHSGWLEIMGSGMVNPKVFEKVRVDPEKYTGFAFGIGIERVAMLKYGVDDMRLFYENDNRFLNQF